MPYSDRFRRKLAGLKKHRRNEQADETHTLHRYRLFWKCIKTYGFLLNKHFKSDNCEKRNKAYNIHHRVIAIIEPSDPAVGSPDRVNSSDVTLNFSSGFRTCRGISATNLEFSDVGK